MMVVLKKFCSWSVGPIGWALTVIITAIVTLATTSYINVVQHNRTVIEGDFGKLKDTSAEFFQLLDAYSGRVRTGTPVDDNIQTQFRLAVLKLYNQAENIAKREPQLKPEFDKYVKALLALQAAANEVQGPLNGRKFVESASGFFAAEQEFKSRVALLQSHWVRLF